MMTAGGNWRIGWFWGLAGWVECIISSFFPFLGGRREWREGGNGVPTGSSAGDKSWKIQSRNEEIGVIIVGGVLWQDP